MKQKKPRKQISYSDAHNKAVSLFKKTSFFMLWAGVLSFFAIIIGIIQISAGNAISELVWPKSNFSLAFSIQVFINALLLLKSGLPNGVSYLIIIVTGLVFSGIFAALGLFSSKGKKWVLFLGAGLYLADFAFLFFLYFLIMPQFGLGFSWTPYAFSLASHFVIMVAIIIAIIEYYQVINIEKIFKGKKEANIQTEHETEVIASGTNNDSKPQ